MSSYHLVRPNPFVLLARRVYRGPDSLRAIGQFFPAIAPAMLKFDLVADSEGMIPCRFLGVIWPFFVRLARRRREDRRPAELQEAFEPVEAFLVLSELFKFGHKKKGEPDARAQRPRLSVFDGSPASVSTECSAGSWLILGVIFYSEISNDLYVLELLQVIYRVYYIYV